MEKEVIQRLLKNKEYSKIREMLVEMNIVDTAVLLETLSKEEIIKAFRLLPKSLAADVFSYMSIETEQWLILSMTDNEIKKIIDELYTDDAVDLLEEMPSNIVKKILRNANAETRADINHLLKYPDESAGSIMTVEFADLKADISVKDAFVRIKKIGIDKETINTCYVVDEERHLLGTVSLRCLLLSNLDDTIKDIMNESPITVHTLDDQEEVANKIRKYDITAMPVVDNESRLVGIITIDDIIDIIQEENTEDIEIMAAISPSERPYMKTSAFETFKNRIPWLLILMISSTVSGKIIQGYEETLSQVAILTAFIPMLMDTGGNSGSQASVSIIRGISLGEITIKDLPVLLFKEFRVSILVGAVLAAANFVKILLIDNANVTIAIVVCLTLFITVVIAKIVGCLLPIFAEKVGFDPAIMASPFITTIVDALSLIVYFQIAVSFLNLS